MLSVTYKPFILSAVRLNVVMLSVVAPFGSTEAIKIIARSQTNLLKLNAPSFLSYTVFHLPNISTAEHCLEGPETTTVEQLVVFRSDQSSDQSLKTQCTNMSVHHG